MGNECPECQAPIADCKMRDIFKEQPKNRADLDLSSIKKGQYKKKNKQFDHQDSDQSLPEMIILQSMVVDKGSKKRQPPSVKKGKNDLVGSSAEPIKPLSLDPQVQTLTLKNGMKYMGGTVDGQPHQKGKIIWEDGTTMLAQFFLGNLAQNQKVSLKTNSQVTYQGQVAEGKANFSGKLAMPDGSSYQGQWKDDLPHGFGKHKMSDGSFYEGQFANGFKFGKGKYYFDHGMYEGHFANDMFEGEGIMILNDGRTIKGHWSNGTLEGKGEIDWTSGEKYVGSFVKNCREGNGTYWFSDGRKWEGQWQNDLQNGFGSYLLPSGQTIKGIWVQGVKKDEMREIQRSKARPL